MHSLLARLPERTFGVSLLTRGSVIWLLVRLTVTAFGAAFPGRHSLRFTPMATVYLVLTAGALAVLETRRRNEHRILANLGISPAMIVLLSTIPAFLGEVAVGIVFR